jgi:hypothetical protein
LRQIGRIAVEHRPYRTENPPDVPAPKGGFSASSPKNELQAEQKRLAAGEDN